MVKVEATRIAFWTILAGTTSFIFIDFLQVVLICFLFAVSGFLDVVGLVGGIVGFSVVCLALFTSCVVTIFFGGIATES